MQSSRVRCVLYTPTSILLLGRNWKYEQSNTTRQSDMSSVKTEFSCPFCNCRQEHEIELPTYTRPKHVCNSCETTHAIAPHYVEQEWNTQHTEHTIQSAVTQYVSRLSAIQTGARGDDRSWPLYLKFGGHMQLYLILAVFGLLIFDIAAVSHLILAVVYSGGGYILANMFVSKQLSIGTLNGTPICVIDRTQWMAYTDGRDDTDS